MKFLQFYCDTFASISMTDLQKIPQRQRLKNDCRVALL